MTAPLDPSKFAAARFRFLEALADDASLPKIAARLAVKLATKYMRAETGGEAWPSIRTLCGDMSVSADSAIRKALSAMVAAGHLEAEPIAGGTTRYRIPAKYFSEPRLKEERGYEDTPPTNEADTPVSFEADTSLSFLPPSPPIFEATSTGHRSPDNETRTVKSGHGEREAQPRENDLFTGEEEPRARKPRNASPPPAEDESFATFWNAYPRHVAKGAARKAFERAVKEGARLEEIVLGAMRLAEERERAEPDDPAKRERFTPYAASWLNAQRWTDTPAARGAGAPSLRSAARAHRPSAVEMALAMNAADGASRR